MSKNLPLHADVMLSRSIRIEVEAALDDVMRNWPDLNLDERILAGEVSMAARRWVTRLEAAHFPDRLPHLPTSLSDGALQVLLVDIADELEVRGYTVSYGVGGPAASEVDVREFDDELARGTPVPEES